MFKISIILPVSNKIFFENIFNSLLNQSLGFENLEIILIDLLFDDDYFIEFSKYDNVVVYEKGFNQLINVYNIGLKYSSTDYLIFSDSQSIFLENGCELLYEQIINENFDIVSGFNTLDGINIDEKIIGDTFDSNEDILNSIKSGVNLINVESYELEFQSIDECPSIITNLNINDKIFRKEFIEINNIQFSESNFNDFSIFLMSALLKTKSIKFINNIITKSYSFFEKYSKNELKKELDCYFEIFYLFEKSNKLKIFIEYFLLYNLEYFIKNHIFGNNLSITDLLDILTYSKPLFKFSIKYVNFNHELYFLFKYMSVGDYENVLRLIYGKSIPNQHNIKIATIADSFTYNSFDFEFDLIYLSPDNWFNQFKLEKPDLFLCESAFYGVPTEKYPDGDWSYKIHTNLDDNNENRIELMKILDYCKKNNILTIFWNKEDPTSFTKRERNFVDTALNFDYIFTSSEECIPHYNKKHHYNVYPLMFAVQPKLFNPINIGNRLSNTVIFAGSWYGTYPKRCNVMTIIFDKVIEKGYDLKIYDRVSFRDWKNFKFPDKYKNCLNDCVDYSEMPRVYKESEIGININTVTCSNTMFARRIFELMASNTLVFSNFSKGVYRLFKDNVFYLDNNDLDLKDKDIDRIKEENLLNVLKNHTYFNRFRQILDTINFKYVPNLKHITLFYNLNSLSDLDKIYTHYYSINYVYKHMKIIIKNNDFSFLPNTVFESDLEEIVLGYNYYFSFVDLTITSDFIENALIHFDYINKDVGIVNDESNKYSFDKRNKIKNIIFNNYYFKSVISNEDIYFDVYCI